MTTVIENQVKVQVSEPTILTANTYYWNSGSSASQRRNSENRRQNEVAQYFESIGLEVTRSGDNVIGRNAEIEATFHYSESCNNVYKHLTIYKNGKKSNITALRKLSA